MSTAPDSIDRYFTRNIVGEAMVVELGPSHGRQIRATSPQWVEVIAERAAVAALAARTLFGQEPGEALAGQPVSLPRLRRWQWRWVVLAVVLWSMLLLGVAWWAWAR